MNPVTDPMEKFVNRFDRLGAPPGALDTLRATWLSGFGEALGSIERWGAEGRDAFRKELKILALIEVMSLAINRPNQRTSNPARESSNHSAPPGGTHKPLPADPGAGSAPAGQTPQHTAESVMEARGGGYAGGDAVEEMYVVEVPVDVRARSPKEALARARRGGWVARVGGAKVTAPDGSVVHLKMEEGA